MRNEYQSMGFLIEGYHTVIENMMLYNYLVYTSHKQSGVCYEETVPYIENNGEMDTYGPLG